ncbi:hypothetical protein AAT19DRAFT_8831 [Rhodotorula toruloides]|uniref:Uncharacterized protein n=1 Tax=Rhodotorula toruloides TaxID=5286 RepID=A0A2T0AIE0_RHOTO|nr:hypothetical protein AAT19DRAFT_8831 [Rhodotorula toruloides]
MEGSVPLGPSPLYRSSFQDAHRLYNCFSRTPCLNTLLPDFRPPACIQFVLPLLFLSTPSSRSLPTAMLRWLLGAFALLAVQVRAQSCPNGLALETDYSGLAGCCYPQALLQCDKTSLAFFQSSSGPFSGSKDCTYGPRALGNYIQFTAPSSLSQQRRPGVEDLPGFVRSSPSDKHLRRRSDMGPRRRSERRHDRQPADLGGRRRWRRVGRTWWRRSRRRGHDGTLLHRPGWSGAYLGRDDSACCWRRRSRLSGRTRRQLCLDDGRHWRTKLCRTHVEREPQYGYLEDVLQVCTRRDQLRLLHRRTT